ncbi:hypothetical protein [Saccharopolyspora rectivirgula]|jgi:hypothetical protein|uniref:Uncharacterized protein n=1 Tax=Saccharopolyspora rectivirgula TaxID=28042 RepID=A0A073B0I5_9PSEU|nr:hypothetical protein [Saccharopolyspora rectivirgula]KEI45071.1 hypothetical protein GU90_07710 [Saccharopolyspora rectivirgula]
MLHPPGHGGLVDRLETLERRLAELSRSSSTGAVCQIRLASDTAIAPATDTVLTAWPQTAEVDTAGMWRHVANGQSYIQLPHAGRWWVHFHSQWAAAPAGYDSNNRFVPNAVAGKVLCNGTSTANSVGSASVMFNSYAPGASPGEGTTLDVFVDDRVFAAGDRLYFGVWTRYSTSVLASINGVRTHVVVRYLGPR